MKQAFMRSIKKLKRVDLFGAQIKNNIDGKSTYRNSLGGLMTIAMIIGIGIIFIYEISDFFAKVNMNAQVYQNFLRSPQQITLDQDNMLFAIGIEQLGLPAFSERPFYNITMTQRLHNQTTGSKQCRDIPLIPCKMERFRNFTETNFMQDQIVNKLQSPKSNGQSVDQQTMENIFTQSNFNQYLCPPLNFNMSMTGAFLDEDFQFVKIQVTHCKNNSNNSYWNPVQFHLNQICASPQTIQDYLFKNNFLRFNLYATNYVINAEQTLNITQMYMSEDLKFLFQPNISNKIVNVFFRNYKVDTDDSLYIRSHNLTNYVYRGESSFTTQNIQNLGYVYKNELTHEQIHNLNLLSSVTLNLRADYFNTQAQRKFQKINSLLSYFGGIFEIFFLGFGLLMAYYNDSYFRLYLSNKLYDFKETKEVQKFSNEDLQDSKQTGGPDPKYELDVKFSDVTNEAEIKELGFKNRSEFLIWYFEKILSKQKKLKLTANYFIYVMSCGKYYSHNQNKLIDKAFKIVEIDLNIKHLLNQGLQLDKLKKLVLTYQ